MSKKKEVKGKLRKALTNEVNEMFTIYLNGHLDLTRDEIKENIEELQDMDIKDIRKKKCELQAELELLFPTEEE